MSFFELDCCRPNIGVTKPVRADACLIALQLRTCQDFDLYEDGRLIRPQQFEAGAVATSICGRPSRAISATPSTPIDLYLPFAALKAISDDLSLARIDDLDHTLGTATWTRRCGTCCSRCGRRTRPRPTTRHRSLSIMSRTPSPPMSPTRTEACEDPTRPDRGGLAPVHARRVKEFLHAHLSGRILLTDLARTCDLSVRQFTRAFRQTTGMAPHQWLLRQRIDKAKDRLVQGVQPLSTVASACGFADQSHFTRVFTRAVGMTPAEWRRMRRR